MSYGRVSDLSGLPDVILSHAGEEGLERALSRQSLSPEILEHPDAVIPMKDLIALYRNASEICAIRSIGLDAVQGLRPCDYGPMGSFVGQAPTLRRAFLRFQKTLPAYESGSRLTLRESGNEFTVGYENIFQNIAGYRHASDMTLRIIESTIREYLGPEWRPIRVETSQPRGCWESDYEDAFEAPVVFRSERIGFVLERADVDRPLIDPDSGTCGLVSFSDVQRLQQDLPKDFPGAVAKIVESRLTAGTIGIDQIASSLGLGTRTFQRRLDEHGLRYRQLVEFVRMRRAQELLTGSDATIAQIGRDVGYSSTSHFTRAFVRANEATPTEFRMRRGGEKHFVH